MKHGVTPIDETPSDDRISVRVGHLAAKLEKTKKRTGQKEAEIVRTALGLFFDTYKTPEAIIAAVINQRAKGAA